MNSIRRARPAAASEQKITQAEYGLVGADDLHRLLQRAGLAQDRCWMNGAISARSTGAGAGAIPGGGQLVQRHRDPGVVQAADPARIDQARGAEGDIAVPARMAVRFVDQEQRVADVPVVQVGIQIARMQVSAIGGPAARQAEAGAGEAGAMIRMDQAGSGICHVRLGCLRRAVNQRAHRRIGITVRAQSERLGDRRQARRQRRHRQPALDSVGKVIELDGNHGVDRLLAGETRTGQPAAIPVHQSARRGRGTPR